MRIRKEHWDKLVPYLKSKFFVVGALFFMWMLLFDRNDLISQFKLKQQLRGLEKEKAYYEAKSIELEQDSKDLFEDPKKLETFAREEYMMKKDNEDVFVIVESED